MFLQKLVSCTKFWRATREDVQHVITVLLQANRWQGYVPCQIGYQRFCRATSRLHQSLTSWAMQVSKEMWEFLLGEVLWAYFRQVLTRENSPSSVLTVRFRAKAEVKLITVILVGKTATFFPHHFSWAYILRFFTSVSHLWQPAVDIFLW